MVTTNTLPPICASAGRISQIRRELAEAWEQIHGTIDSDAELAAA